MSDARKIIMIVAMWGAIVFVMRLPSAQWPLILALVVIGGLCTVAACTIQWVFTENISTAHCCYKDGCFDDEEDDEDNDEDLEDSDD